LLKKLKIQKKEQKDGDKDNDGKIILKDARGYFTGG